MKISIEDYCVGKMENDMPEQPPFVAGDLIKFRYTGYTERDPDNKTIYLVCAYWHKRKNDSNCVNRVFWKIKLLGGEGLFHVYGTKQMLRQRYKLVK